MGEHKLKWMDKSIELVILAFSNDSGLRKATKPSEICNRPAKKNRNASLQKNAACKLGLNVQENTTERKGAHNRSGINLAVSFFERSRG